MLPDQIPVHFNAAGEPTRFAEPIWWNIFMTPIINASLLITMVLVNIGIEKSKLQIDTHKPALSFAQHRVYRRRMGHALGFMTLGFVIALTPISFPTLFSDASWISGLMQAIFPIILFSSFVLCLPVILAYVWSGQGGCKVKIDMPDEETTNTDVSPKVKGRGDDKYWLLGMFYHNPGDPAFLIESRFGSNFSLNYARMAAKIGVVVSVILLIAIYVWVTVKMI